MIIHKCNNDESKAPEHIVLQAFRSVNICNCWLASMVLCIHSVSSCQRIMLATEAGAMRNWLWRDVADGYRDLGCLAGTCTHLQLSHACVLVLQFNASTADGINHQRILQEAPGWAAVIPYVFAKAWQVWPSMHVALTTAVCAHRVFACLPQHQCWWRAARCLPIQQLQQAFSWHVQVVSRMVPEQHDLAVYCAGMCAAADREHWNLAISWHSLNPAQHPVHPAAAPTPPSLWALWAACTTLGLSATSAAWQEFLAWTAMQPMRTCSDTVRVVQGARILSGDVIVSPQQRACFKAELSICRYAMAKTDLQALTHDWSLRQQHHPFCHLMPKWYNGICGYCRPTEDCPRHCSVKPADICSKLHAPQPLGSLTTPLPPFLQSGRNCLVQPVHNRCHQHLMKCWLCRSMDNLRRRQTSDTIPAASAATTSATAGPSMPQQATAGIQGMLSFITTNKITEGRPVRSKLADSSKSAAGMKWIQPSGEFDSPTLLRMPLPAWPAHLTKFYGGL